MHARYTVNYERIRNNQPEEPESLTVSYPGSGMAGLSFLIGTQKENSYSCENRPCSCGFSDPVSNWQINCLALSTGRKQPVNIKALPTSLLKSLEDAWAIYAAGRPAA